MNIESSVVFFPCKSLEQTVQFYEKIGLTLHKNMGSCVIMDSGCGFLGFCVYTDGRPMATGECISFNMANEAEVDAKYAQLMSMGIEAIGAPAKHSVFPVYSFFFRDINGYLLEFQKILI